MKKIALLFVSLCMLFSLVACSTDLTPIEKCQQKAVSIGEQFLNFEITAAEAKEQLGALRVPETEGNGQLFLECDIAALSFSISRQGGTYEEVEKKVESIRKSTYE